ncbi:MAG: cob(I)yrinic acid a,c-diamide adenosyltransferase [Desulfovibrio sp.]|nr:cob(I)yrinic acid a,c-diamide adenosyltransferase [Desulfovibrio sp.]
MIICYTGMGKGKTSACLGQALRALGHGYSVCFCQFIKRDHQSGEQSMLKRLLGDRFLANGVGMVSQAKDRSEHKKRAQQVLLFAHQHIPTTWLLILDELCVALSFGLIDTQACIDLLTFARSQHCHVIVSGRKAPPWLCAMADCVTVMENEKHPFQKGEKALKGIDY